MKWEKRNRVKERWGEQGITSQGSRITETHRKVAGVQ
jgi:hypothetical protein